MLRARKAWVPGNNLITVLEVQLLDTFKWRWALDNTDDWDRFTHSFVISAWAEGVRIFQAYHSSHDMPCVTLLRHIRTRGARLRTWEEATTFVTAFKFLSTPAVSAERLENTLSTNTLQQTWPSKHNDAYLRCFDYDINSNIASSFKDQTRRPSYNPHVRILEFQNVTGSDIQKFDWSLWGGKGILILLCNFWRSIRMRCQRRSRGRRRGRVILYFELVMKSDVSVCRAIDGVSW
jgi:hypothetical protein